MVNPFSHSGKNQMWISNTITFMVVVFIVSVMFIQACSSSKAQYSPFTRRFLQELEKSRKSQQDGSEEFDLSKRTREEFLVKKADKGYVVHGMIKVDHSINPADLLRLDIRITSQRGDIWAVIIPLSSLKPLGGINGVKRIEIDSSVRKR